MTNDNDDFPLGWDMAPPGWFNESSLRELIVSGLSYSLREHVRDLLLELDQEMRGRPEDERGYRGITASEAIEIEILVDEWSGERRCDTLFSKEPADKVEIDFVRIVHTSVATVLSRRNA